MPSGVYQRSPEYLEELRARMAKARSDPSWRTMVSKSWIKPGQRLPQAAWTEERRKQHGIIMSKANVVEKLLRRRTVSPCEVILKSRMETAGFIWQVSIKAVGVADYAMPSKKLAIEFEAAFYDPKGNTRFAKKIRAYEANGWNVLVFAYWHVYKYPDHVWEQISNALI